MGGIKVSSADEVTVGPYVGYTTRRQSERQKASRSTGTTDTEYI